MKKGVKRGYYVNGEFVQDGSELDLELKADSINSRTAAKRDSDEAQKIGVALLDLGPNQLAKLTLPEKLLDALAEAKRITSFEGKRRQVQYIGKLMRNIELAPIRQALAEAHGGSARETLALHHTEQWRDQLIAQGPVGDGAFERWIAAHPRTDTQQLRSLVRQARKDAVPSKPGEAARHGKAYREIFQLVRNALQAPERHDDPADLPRID